MKQSKSSHTRRSFLKSAGCQFLAIPFLESFASAQELALQAPKKLVFLGGGYGFTHQSFYPKQAGAFSKIGLTPGLAPLERHQDDLTMVANLHNPHMTDPHAGSAGYLSGAKGKVSCDQVAAQHFSGDARYPSLVLTSTGERSGHGKGGISLSNSPSGKPIAGFKRPLDAYHQLFGNGSQSKEEISQMVAQKRSVLDVIATNGITMKNRVSREDHERLEEYFESLREIETGLQRQAEWSDTPLPKAPFAEPLQGLSGIEEIKMMLDLIIVALQTNSTRVATYRLPVQSLLTSLEITISSHTMSHYSSSPTKRAASEKRDRKLMELFAYFIDRLKATKDRQGDTLFDTSIVSYGSNLRTGHTSKNCPALLSGGGLQNIKRGQHIMLDKLTPMSNYWLTILNEAGVKTTQFNDSTGPLEQIMT